MKENIINQLLCNTVATFTKYKMKYLSYDSFILSRFYWAVWGKKKRRLVPLLAEVDSPENVENQKDGANFKQLSIFQLLISPSLSKKDYKWEVNSNFPNSTMIWFSKSPLFWDQIKHILTLNLLVKLGLSDKT